MKYDKKAAKPGGTPAKHTPATKPLPATMQTRLMALGAVMAMVLLSGCASTPATQEGDLYQYNPATGYPAVGGPNWRL